MDLRINLFFTQKNTEWKITLHSGKQIRTGLDIHEHLHHGPYKSFSGKDKEVKPVLEFQITNISDIAVSTHSSTALITLTW